MTKRSFIHKKKTDIGRGMSIICLITAFLMISFGEELKAAVYRGFLFAFTTIIPTLFPFFILSDLWSACFRINPDSFPARAFKRLFGISGIAMPVWFAGLICGFPLAVKNAAKLKREGMISIDEFERLAGFSNNPSLAFVIFGVGGGILGSVRHGVWLYISVILSSIIVGIIFRIKAATPSYFSDNSRQTFDLVESIKSAGINSITVASYIIFFSGIIGLLSEIVGEPVFTLISPLFEVANSVKMLSDCKYLSAMSRFSLISLALGFSGFSVHLQAFSLFPSEAKKIRYLIMKLLQGFVCAAISTIIFFFI